MGEFLKDAGSIAGLTLDTTLDGILNRRIMLEQPVDGFRVAVDTVLLAAAVPAQAGQTALEFGCGVGGAMLALACRVSDITVTGIEIQPDMAALCQRNIQRNAMTERLTVLCGDITTAPLPCPPVHHVLMNPPYHDAARHDVSAHDGKRIANSADAADLGLWIAKAADGLLPDGCLTIIHRADRMKDIAVAARRLFGLIEILPILPAVNAQPRRVIVRAHKQGPAEARQALALILHGPDGRFTNETESILRHNQALNFVYNRL